MKFHIYICTDIYLIPAVRLAGSQDVELADFGHKAWEFGGQRELLVGAGLQQQHPSHRICV